MLQRLGGELQNSVPTSRAQPFDMGWGGACCTRWSIVQQTLSRVLQLRYCTDKHC